MRGVEIAKIMNEENTKFPASSGKATKNKKGIIPVNPVRYAILPSTYKKTSLEAFLATCLTLFIFLFLLLLFGTVSFYAIRRYINIPTLF